jgi:hypothetical protein
MRYLFGYDQAQETVATGIIRGAVKGALDADVPTEMVALAVCDIAYSDSPAASRAWARSVNHSMRRAFPLRSVTTCQ